MAHLQHARIKRIVLSWAFLLLGLSSLSVTTYAWFSSNRQTSASVTGIKVHGPDDVRIYHYKKNYTTVDGTKVYGGWNYAKRSTVTFTSFDEEFESVGTLEYSNFTPNAAYTYAFQMNKGRYSDCRFTLEGFICQTYAALSGGGSIYLSSAIDMYFSTYFYTDTGTDTLDQVVLTHLHNASLTDVFTSTAQQASDLILYDQDYQNDNMLVFFTIVGSDDPSTYYSYNTSAETYTPDSTNGNSNVYKNLTIDFKPLQIKGENE
jgi:hypothetical protein